MTQTKTQLTKWTNGVQKYQGSCRCGTHRFEADIDFEAGTTRCNCTICTKSGWWGVLIRPDAFRRVSPTVPEVTGAGTEVARVRCETCGIVPYGHGDVPELGGEFYSINVRCLDGVDLDGVMIHYLDGRHDTWALLSEAPYWSPFPDAGGPGIRAYTLPKLEQPT